MKFVSDISNVWLRYSRIINCGQKLNFRWEQLPTHRYEELLDFKMKYYVKDELTHVMAGIHKNPKAVEEYRNIISKLYKHPSYQIAICCVDDNSNKMVGFSSMKLYKSGEMYEDVVQAETPEVQRFYTILHKWNNLCPVPQILTYYGADQYFDDNALVIHPDYRGYGLTTEATFLRDIICKANNVSLTGGWITSTKAQHTSKKEGWKTIYRISSEDLEKILGIKILIAQDFTYGVKIVK